MDDSDRNASAPDPNIERLRHWLQSLRRPVAHHEQAARDQSGRAGKTIRKADDRTPSTHDVERALRWIERLMTRHGGAVRFTIGVPGRPITEHFKASANSVRLLDGSGGPPPGEPLCCWLAAGRDRGEDWTSWDAAIWVGAVASRLSRFPADVSAVLAALKRLAARITDDELLFAVERTTLEPYLRHLARCHGARHVVASVCEGPLRRWLELCDAAANAVSEPQSPPVHAEAQRRSIRLICWTAGFRHIPGTSPWRDVLAVNVPDVLHVLSVREGGHVHQTTRERLRAATGADHASRKVFVSPAASPAVRRELSHLGAVLDHTAAATAKPVGRAARAPRPAHRSQKGLRPAVAWDTFRRWLRTATPVQRAAAIEQWRRTVRGWLKQRGLAAGGDWNFLTHWTRLPLLDEHVRNHPRLLDRLFESNLDDPEGIETLVLDQILREGVLRGSAAGIRGRTPVVCWTAVPLWLWPMRRTYRTHRVRWDFDWYGVCVRRLELLRHGARPVQYGAEDDWSALSVAEQPFFQASGAGRSSATDRSANGPANRGATSNCRSTGRRDRRIDWQVEQEWRVIGDFAIRPALEAGEAFVFTRTLRQADCLSRRFGCAVFAFERLCIDESNLEAATGMDVD